MNNNNEQILPINITEEMKSSYIDYSMSVIVGRALPDIRDGLKPAHRRVLFGMSELGLGPGTAYKKSARIVGEVLGKYHPHGDASVYDTMVRMAQVFSLRYPLVDGQGNFGSVDGDGAAAMRYTEARLTRLASEMLRDIKEDTTDFQENFDGSLEEPVVLPSAVPNLLVNGGDGIAVGMATKIPPHNLGEVVDAIIAYIDDPDIDALGLMEHLPGPDFPTGGIIYGHAGIQAAYHGGRGRVVMRARMHEEKIPSNRTALVITEIPYQVNKSTLVEKIAQLVTDKRITDISDLRDESDRDGMRIVIELKKDATPTLVENLLYKYSACQHTFGVNMVALVGGRPMTVTLKDTVRHFVDHRHEVVSRRSRHRLVQARARGHVLEGLLIALDHLDVIITIIRHSSDPDAALDNLQKGVYPSELTGQQLQRLGLPAAPPGASDHGRKSWLSEKQAAAILALRLRRLTGLERRKIEAEYREVARKIERLRSILASEHVRMLIIKEELIELKSRYGDDRRTEIDFAGGEDFLIEDLVEDCQVVVTISRKGLIKRTTATEFRRQGRGGKGVRGGGLRQDDFLEHMFVSNNHDYILFFTSHGRCYWLRAYQIPPGGRVAKGRNIRNLIGMPADDRVCAVLAIRKESFRDPDFLDSHYVTMATAKGQVKKTALRAYSRPRTNGIWAIRIREGDKVLEARLTDGDATVVLAASNGRAMRFHEKDVRAAGRYSGGVRGMRLRPDENVVGMVVLTNGEDKDMLSVTSRGFGKRFTTDAFRVKNRGGMGVYAQRETARTGSLVAINSVNESDDIMIMSNAGTLIRTNVAGISVKGRNALGISLMRLNDGDSVAAVTRVMNEDIVDV